MESFGKNVQTIRENLGWSRAEFQRRLEENGLTLHTTTLRRIETGEQEPKLSEALIFSQVLCVPVETLGLDSAAAPKLANVQATTALLRDALREALEAVNNWAMLHEKLEEQILEARAAGVPDKALFESAEFANRFSDVGAIMEYWEGECGRSQDERETAAVDIVQRMRDRWAGD